MKLMISHDPTVVTRGCYMWAQDAKISEMGPATPLNIPAAVDSVETISAEKQPWNNTAIYEAA